MDISTISIILLIGMLALLAIGMPLGFASGFLATVVLVLKFEPTIGTKLTSDWAGLNEYRLYAAATQLMAKGVGHPLQSILRGVIGAPPR